MSLERSLARPKKIRGVRGELDAAQKEIDRLKELNAILAEEAQAERAQRVAAQRGLVPYVRSLEAFNAWLNSEGVWSFPLSTLEVDEKLKALGLVVKLGYDPDQDPKVIAEIREGKIPAPA